MNGRRSYVQGTALAILFLVAIAIGTCMSIHIPAGILAGANTKTDAASIQSGIEEGYNTSFPSKELFVNLNGLSHKLLMQREMNEVLLLNNGHGSELMENQPESAVSRSADALDEFNQYLSSRGVNFLYCQVPYKNEEGNSQLPAGAVDWSNSVANRFLSALTTRDVPYLDLRQCIREDGIDLYSLFLKTEHHWSPAGAFYGFTKLCDYMRENYGDVIDEAVTDINCYELVTYPNMSIGYYAQRTGVLFLPREDYALIYPKFSTRQTCEIVHRGVTRNGSFYDAIFDTSFIAAKGDQGLYRTYIGGDFPLVLHESETARNEKTVLMFIDSFGTMLESFLTTAYQHVYAVDLRWVLRTNMQESAVDFVERFQPDHVIVALNPNQIGVPEQFDFGLN